MKNLFPYIYDFLSLVFESQECREYIKNIILFGSVARGEHDEMSDIDIFINTQEVNAGKLEPLIKEAEKRFGLSIENRWALMGIETPIRYIIGDLETYTWKALKMDIISSGLVLYGKFESVKEDAKHYAMFNYSLSGLPQKNKMRLIRQLFGYRIKKGKKVYEQTGYLKEIGGKKPESCIFVPVEKSAEVQKLLNSFKITPKITEVWEARA